MVGVYSCIVTLMQDLELLLPSYDRIFSAARHCSRPCPFTKEELQILYENVSFTDSLLRDPSGDSYNREVINSFGHRIIQVALRAENYVDLQVFNFLQDDKAKKRSGIYLTGNLHLDETFHSKGWNESWIRAVREGEIDFEKLRRLTEGTEDSLSYDPKALVEINKELCFINNELKRLNLDNGKARVSNHPEDHRTSASAGESFNLFNSNNGGKLVGLEAELMMMLDHLTGQPLKLKVLAISGMGGIGKTTFTRRLFDDPLIMHHFDVRAWITVSQQFQFRKILLGLLNCVAQKSLEIYDVSIEQLCEQVYKSLKHKRYLIVLDDMWDNKDWNVLKRTFPDDRNGSRILITSRLTDVATHVSPDTPPHLIRFLTEDESWELFSLKLFGNESCPLSLVPVGKEIARRCQGLPLAIIVVGGILSKMKLTMEIWEEVAEHVGSVVMEDPHNCQKILALSYDNLPDQLKSCFLYMGVFPEDYEIPAKKLIWLWISEGFVRPRKQHSLEEVAEHYLEELISRSLVLVKRKGANGRPKTCYIHDLMRELCLRESEKEFFFSSGQLHRRTFQSDMQSLRRLSFQSEVEIFLRTRSSFPLTRSLFCFETLTSTDLKHCSGIALKLLRVLEVEHIHQIIMPVGLVHLRYLVLTIKNSSMMAEILRMLLFLQTFVVYCEWDGLLPWNIFNMQQLRHFYLKKTLQSDLSDDGEEIVSEAQFSRVHGLQNIEKGQMVFKRQRLLLSDIKPCSILQNLQSLSGIRALECTKEAFLKMPNLKKLGIHETEEDCMFHGWIKNLVLLQELETLKYSFYNPFVSTKMKPDRLPSMDFFPQKLMKLTLSGTSFPWEDMSKLAMLPKLEVLKLRNYAFSGIEWRTKGGGFSCLKFLLIGSTNLELWESDGTHFPSLQHLILKHCKSLRTVPDGLGAAPLFEKIELHCCSESAATSARQIQEEQQRLGNDYLTVYITQR